MDLMSIRLILDSILFVVAAGIAARLTIVSSSRAAQKSREKWCAIPAEKRAAHDMVGKPPSRVSVVLGVIVILVCAYAIVRVGI